MLALSERQLRSWEKQGFISGGETFTFADIIALRTLLSLRKSRVAPKAIGQALHSLRRKLAHIKKPLSELRITADGKRITVHLSGNKMEALTGQFFFDFEVTGEARIASFPSPAKKTKAADTRESEKWFQHGLSLEETGAPASAVLEAYTKAVELNPEAAGALVNLGTIYFRTGKLAKAEKLYKRAITADASYALAHFNLGNLYDESADHSQAREHYLAAIKLNPRYADAWYNLALLSEQIGDNLKAVSYWNTYLKLDATSSWAQTARRQLERLKEVTLLCR